MTATSHNAQARPLPAPLGAMSTLALDPAASPEDAAAIARYEALSAPERMRACNLLAQSGCSLAQACAAIEALRPV